MNEMEMLEKARLWTERMARGFDPVTEEAAGEADCINKVEVSRCLFYVCGVLDKVIAAGGAVKAGRGVKPKKRPFEITQEALDGFAFSKAPITISEMAKRINDLVDTETMAGLKYASLTAFLMRHGYLEETVRADGGRSKTPTERGRAIGITTEERSGMRGIYQVTVYDREAQQFILDNLDGVIEINNNKA